MSNTIPSCIFKVGDIVRIKSNVTIPSNINPNADAIVKDILYRSYRGYLMYVRCKSIHTGRYLTPKMFYEDELEFPNYFVSDFFD